MSEIELTNDEIHELLTATDRAAGGTALYTARLKLADEKAALVKRGEWYVSLVAGRKGA